MNIHESTLNLVKTEKQYTAKIIQNLVKIDREKLYSDWKYPTLFKYLTKGLGYSEAEANLRVGAVRLARQEKSVVRKIASGALSLSNASMAQSVAKKNQLPIAQVLKVVEGKSTRKAKEAIRQQFTPKQERREVLVLDERMLKKLDRLKKEYGDLSTFELLDTLIEEKLKTPKVPARDRSYAPKNSRYITVKVKHQTNKGKCQNCGTKRYLEYDHQKEFSLGGDNSAKNIQMLCWSCNHRKEIKRKRHVI